MGSPLDHDRHEPCGAGARAHEIDGGEELLKKTGAANLFTVFGEPDKLKRALRADIDESAWSTLYSTTSRPFAPPESGKIAVKVINHYGDEVLKIYEV